MKAIPYAASVVASLLLAACSSNTTERALSSVGIYPVELPNPHIAGYQFPDTLRIPQWVQQQDSAAIYQHGWGVWTALTSATNQVYNNDTLLVYQTWHTKADADSLMQVEVPAGQMLNALARRPGGPKRILDFPRQHLRDAHLLTQLQKGAASKPDTVLEQVSYNPNAATSLITGKLFWASKLKKLATHETDLGNFSTSAVAVKAMYEIVPGPKRSTGLFKMKVWSGTPSGPVDSGGYGTEKWPNSIYVDIDAHTGAKQPAAALPLPVYHLKDFIYYTLSSAEANALNQTHNTPAHAQAGDYAILVGMHITTNEIANWTWQTMWWMPNPNVAVKPSSAGVVAARPSQLKGAARHYAMAIAYQMVAPATTPPMGTYQGQQFYQAAPVYAFNPYLEAPFSTATFGGPAGYGYLLNNNVLVINSVGIQTNCMSCHAQASYQYTPGYVPDAYIELDSTKAAYKTLFKGALRTDFLWSIPDMATMSADSDR